jgi:hypothetical protein
MSIPRFVPLALVIQGLAFASAPSEAAPASPSEASLVQVWRGAFDGKSVPGSEVIQDADHWNEVWRGLNRDTPPFDFVHDIAVVAYAGTQGTSGYAVEFLRPELHGNNLMVTWRVVGPPRGTMQSQVLTQPWAIQAFPRPRGEVMVEQRVTPEP